MLRDLVTSLYAWAIGPVHRSIRGCITPEELHAYIVEQLGGWGGPGSAGLDVEDLVEPGDRQDPAGRR